jgi:hypothetical protein
MLVRRKTKFSFHDVVLTRNNDGLLIREGGPDLDRGVGKPIFMLKRFACAVMLSALFRPKKIAQGSG